MALSPLALLLLLPAALPASNPPSTYFQICKRNDPGVSECIKNSIMNSKSRMVEGIPALNFPPLDPFLLPMLNTSGDIGINFSLKDTNITGLKGIEILDCHFDVKNLVLNFSMKVPHLDFEGDYEMSGKLVSLPVRGNGVATLNFTNVMAVLNSKWEKYNVKGKDYLRVIKAKWEINPENAHTYFSNLFNGDKTLGEATNRVMNENWKEIYADFRYITEETFKLIVIDLANRVLKHYTYNDWLPE